MTDMGLEIAHVAVTTFGTMCMIGLGFLFRPSRATVLWSLGFIVSMIGAYGQLAAAAIGDDTLRWAALGVLLGAPALAWSGLRALRGARAFGFAGPLASAVGAAALVLAGPTDAYAWTFRAVYCLSAVFGCLTLAELLRRPERGMGTALPLALFSAGFAAAAATSVVTGIFQPVPDAAVVAALRQVNLLGMIIYTACALTTLLFLARDGARRDALSDSPFPATAADRLRRAEASGESSWAVLVVRLDDSEDIRVAAGDAGFAAICDEVRAEVRASVPTDADIGRLDAATTVVLLSRPTATITELVAGLLRTIATPDRRAAMNIPVSASVGWAGVAEHGYDLDRIVAAARRAAQRAAGSGGDRWARAGLG